MIDDILDNGFYERIVKRRARELTAIEERAEKGRDHGRRIVQKRKEYKSRKTRLSVLE